MIGKWYLKNLFKKLITKTIWYFIHRKKMLFITIL